jgi:hypothetical protein
MARLRDLCFELPPRFEDLTEYFFTSEAGPILKLALSNVEVLPKDVDAWLLEARRKLEVFPKAQRGALQTYENPKYVVRGFETDFGSSVVVAALAVLEADTVFMHVKCGPAAESSVRHIFRTLDRDAAGTPSPMPGVASYSALGLRFDSIESFERPPTITLHGPDRLRIFGYAGPRPIKSRRPDWSPNFGLSVDTVLTETLQGTEAVSGRSTPLHPQGPAFKTRYWFASALTDGAERHLLYGDAVSHLGSDYFRLELRGEGPIAQQLDVWRAFLQSGRRG